MTDGAWLNEQAEQVGEWAQGKGWWDEPHSFGDKIALMHTELSEALEEYRNGHEVDEVYFVTDKNGLDKPEGVPIELMDCFIRILDFAAEAGIDLSTAYALKRAYNETRSYKHGGKRL